MKRLNYELLRENGYDGFIMPADAPLKVLQFGEGNFMRAFTDYWFDLMNEKGRFGGRIQMLTPIGCHPAFNVPEILKEQDGLYTLYLQGSEKGEKVRNKRIITSVNGCIDPYLDYQAFLDLATVPSLRFITSNTTEAGIAYDPSSRFDDAPPAGFPAKLCRFLYERWKQELNGFIILSCELIDNNGAELKKCVLQHCADWKLEPGFVSWIENDNLFCSTLVDRIVPGYPRMQAQALCEENGYEDRMMDTGELFGLWVIEGPASLYDELPVREAGLEDNILIVDDHTPYKQRKVRILNGAHTSFVPGAYLAGQNIVRDCMADDVIRGFMERCIYSEIIPTLSLPEEELMAFAGSVTDRFKNPFIDHELLSICLNSTSKWKARVLPSVKGYLVEKKELPVCLTASFAMYLAFYRRAEKTPEGYFGTRGNDRYEVRDDADVMVFFAAHKDEPDEVFVRHVCGCEKFWGEDLNSLDGFAETVIKDLQIIEDSGTYALMNELAGNWNYSVK